VAPYLPHLAMALAMVGLVCFMWPLIQKRRGKAPAETAESRAGLRSPMWWAGFVLTLAALALQRLAAQGDV
jgi:hypothetical protein